MDIELLKSALDAIVKDPSLAPRKDGTTYCNIGLIRIANLFGCTELNGMMANQIYDHVASSKAWLKVDREQATDFALRGNFGIAAQKEDVHGHVATVYPAVMQMSNSLGHPVPILANCGKKNGIMKASECFPVSRKDADGKIVPNEPDYFLHLG